MNACIAPLAALDGRRLITIEHLKADGKLHPAQQAMVDRHGSQCGFCTPGIVMSLFALWLNEEEASEEHIEDALAGNLWPVHRLPADHRGRLRHVPERGRSEEGLARRRSRNGGTSRRPAGQPAACWRSFDKDGRRFIAPASLDDFATIYDRNHGATILAGATDVGLWITKEMRVLETVLHPGRIAALEEVADGKRPSPSAP